MSKLVLVVGRRDKKKTNNNEVKINEKGKYSVLKSDPPALKNCK